MPTLLSESQLHTHIVELKDAVDAYNQANRQLVFFNDSCYYDHIVRQPKVEKLLNAVEPYIPLVINQETLQQFLNLAQREEDYNEEYADSFMLQARIEFIRNLKKADTPDRWSQLADSCGTIRDIKEQLCLLAISGPF